ncbi:MAG TPA: bifunctional alpha,alpha-trehalose-phosphate synthase (UDP-forming)/trehalose-phosphatase [Chitinophagaceae bacterium]
MSRLIVVSNRLPFSVDHEGDEVKMRQSSGGLVSAITSYFESNISKEEITEKLWVGVADFLQEDWDQLVANKSIEYDFNIHPLFVDKQVYKDYYNGFSNSVLWPLFHYFPTLVEYPASYYEAYLQINRKFCIELMSLIQPDDIIWIHDYQLMLLPQMLRQQKPNATIGFFLHIPFPSYEIYRLLPNEWKKSLLLGVMGADLVGFHTHDYVQHFIQSTRMILGTDTYFHTVQYQNRLVKIDLFPIGIDYKKFNGAANNPEVVAYKDEVKKNFDGKKIIFSVDRLDYTKGIMDRLNGFEYFLEQNQQWKEKVFFILNVVPSRDEIQSYNEQKRQLEEKISTINGKFSTISWQPIIYRYQHLPFHELSALYQMADVALITPLRDGMNLVAKEYVASSASRTGVLILSELAGAASELNEALLVNPTDVHDIAQNIEKALNMPLQEQRDRIVLMQRRLQEYDVVRWVNDFLEQLKEAKKEQQKINVKALDEKTVATICRHYAESKKRFFLIDYDGTLVPITKMPADAVPVENVNEFLSSISSDPDNHVAIVSGRDAGTMEKWFGQLPLTLVAEHGASIKMRNETWQQLVTVSDQWKDQVRRIMQLFVTRCVGSFIEEKTSTLAWHYRNTQVDLGFTRSRELINNLSQLIQNTPLQVIDGNRVVEVRMAGFDKGTITLKILNEAQPDFVLCIGDDTTDEDMFKVLEDSSFIGKTYTIKIGSRGTAAKYTLPSQQQVLPLLTQLQTCVKSKEELKAKG